VLQGLQVLDQRVDPVDLDVLADRGSLQESCHRVADFLGLLLEVPGRLVRIGAGDPGALLVLDDPIEVLGRIAPRVGGGLHRLDVLLVHLEATLQELADRVLRHADPVALQLGHSHAETDFEPHILDVDTSLEIDAVTVHERPDRMIGVEFVFPFQGRGQVRQLLDAEYHVVSGVGDPGDIHVLIAGTSLQMGALEVVIAPVVETVFQVPARLDVFDPQQGLAHRVGAIAIVGIEVGERGVDGVVVGDDEVLELLGPHGVDLPEGQIVQGRFDLVSDRGRYLALVINLDVSGEAGSAGDAEVHADPFVADLFVELLGGLAASLHQDEFGRGAGVAGSTGPTGHSRSAGDALVLRAAALLVRIISHFLSPTAGFVDPGTGANRFAPGRRVRSGPKGRPGALH